MNRIQELEKQLRDASDAYYNSDATLSVAFNICAVCLSGCYVVETLEKRA